MEFGLGWCLDYFQQQWFIGIAFLFIIEGTYVVPHLFDEEYNIKMIYCSYYVSSQQWYVVIHGNIFCKCLCMSVWAMKCSFMKLCFSLCIYAVQLVIVI